MAQPQADLKPWRQAKAYLSSLWLLERKDERPLKFHGAFVPAVAEGLILRHTKPGDWVWDPMAGSGTVAMVCNYHDRRCLMSDLTPTAPDIYQADARLISIRAGSPLVDGNVERPVPIPATCLSAPYALPPFQFDLVILHPPYHNIIKFSDKPEDLSNCDNLPVFLSRFSEVCRNVARHLKPGGYLGLVIGDIWDSGQVVPLGFRCMDRALTALGPRARLKAIVVKDIKNHARHKRGSRNLWLSRYYRWGTVEFAHEYIFSIQKG